MSWDQCPLFSLSLFSALHYMYVVSCLIYNIIPCSYQSVWLTPIPDTCRSRMIITYRMSSTCGAVMRNSLGECPQPCFSRSMKGPVQSYLQNMPYPVNQFSPPYFRDHPCLKLYPFLKLLTSWKYQKTSHLFRNPIWESGEALQPNSNLLSSETSAEIPANS